MAKFSSKGGRGKFSKTSFTKMPLLERWAEMRIKPTSVDTGAVIRVAITNRGPP